MIIGSAERLAAHLAGAPERQFTMLDCHDGIPVLPDLDGVLTLSEMRELATHVLKVGGNVNRILSGAGASEGVDIHQLNTTYFSALESDEDRYVLARAVQLFAPGIPQIYYVGLLAGANDPEAVATSGDGRAINRHNYRTDEIGAALRRPVVGRLLEIVRLRRNHPAFLGTHEFEGIGSVLRMTWRHHEHRCELRADLRSGVTEIEASTEGANAP